MSVLRKSIVGLALISFVFVGCTRYANEQELKDLEDTKMAATKAERKLSNLKRERAELEDKLAEKEKELDAAKKEKSTVEGRLK